MHDVVVGFPSVPQKGRGEMRFPIVEEIHEGLNDFVGAVDAGQPVATIPVFPFSVLGG